MKPVRRTPKSRSCNLFLMARCPIGWCSATAVPIGARVKLPPVKRPKNTLLRRPPQTPSQLTPFLNIERPRRCHWCEGTRPLSGGCVAAGARCGGGAELLVHVVEFGDRCLRDLLIALGLSLSGDGSCKLFPDRIFGFRSEDMHRFPGDACSDLFMNLQAVARSKIVVDLLLLFFLWCLHSFGPELCQCLLSEGVIDCWSAHLGASAPVCLCSED